MKTEVRLLNHEILKTTMDKQNIKIYWLADQVGVTRYTVMRWMKGSVRKIKLDHLQRLATILDCNMDSLTFSDDLFQTSLMERKFKSTIEIIKRDLASILIKAGEADLYEVIVKALEIDNMPIRYQFELYFTLSSALFNQAKYEEALVFAKKSFTVAKKTKNPSRLMKAAGLIVVSYSALGKYSEATLAHRWIEESRDQVLPSLYYIERSRILQTYIMMEKPERAIAHFKEMEVEYLKHVDNFSQKTIVFYTIANSYFKLNQLIDAKFYYALGLKTARTGQFAVLEAECRIGLLRVKAEIAKGNDLLKVIDEAADIVKTFKRGTMDKVSYILLMSRVFEKLNRPEKSRVFLRKGLRIYRESPSIVNLFNQQLKRI